jgi:uncharacterized membrane protein (DUF106 family)
MQITLSQKMVMTQRMGSSNHQFSYLLFSFKVIISPIFRYLMNWARDGSLANQMAQFLLFMCINVAYKRPVVSPWKFWERVSLKQPV